MLFYPLTLSMLGFPACACIHFMEAMESSLHVLLSRPIGSYLLKYPSHAFLKRFLMFVREGPCLKKRPPPQQSHELQVDIDSHSRRKEQLNLT